MPKILIDLPENVYNRVRSLEPRRDGVMLLDTLMCAVQDGKIIEENIDLISVTEKLPEWDEDCLVVDADGNYGVGYYREDVKAWDSPSWGWLERKDKVDNHEAYTQPCGIGKVVAWIPLSKLIGKYKGGSNEQ